MNDTTTDLSVAQMAQSETPGRSASTPEPDVDAANEMPSSAESEKSTIKINFADFACDPIGDLKYQIECNGQIFNGVTDANGDIRDLGELEAGSTLKIRVWRAHTKDFKEIAQLLTQSGECGYTCYSPKLRFDSVETEPLAGSPGAAEEDKPPVPPVVDKQAVSPTVPSTATGSPPRTEPVKRPPVHGRTKEGLPLTKFVDANVDWLKRKVLPVLNMWTWADFSAVAAAGVAHKLGTTAGKKPAKAVQAGAMIGKKSAGLRLKDTQSTPVQSGKQLDDAGLVKLKALIDFAEAQVLLDYKATFPKARGLSATVRSAYTEQESPKFVSKEAAAFKGRCLAYVKIALWKSGYANNITGTENAKDSGPDWVKFGFKDVTNSLPQVEVDYGICFTAEEEKLRKQHSGIKQKMKLGKITNYEYLEQLSKLPAEPKGDRLTHVQANLIYALPGDVIVYEQVKPVSKSAAGHIDIRTYHGFVSDAAWGIMPALGGTGRGSKRYRVTGVYRKSSDTLAWSRVQAFLRIIREHEAKGFKDPYRALRFDSRQRSNPFITFSDFSDHPYLATKDNLPAGAYQIKTTTWKEIIEVFTGWPKIFDPQAQDRAALYILQSMKERTASSGVSRTALGYILEGKIEKAVESTKLYEKFAFLPGGGRQTQISMSEVKMLFKKYIEEFV